MIAMDKGSRDATGMEPLEPNFITFYISEGKGDSLESAAVSALGTRGRSNNTRPQLF
jgi:hypothetical protein